MWKILLSTAVGMGTFACGGDDSGTGPTPVNVTGTFFGSYTASVDPGVVYQGTLQLTQSGTTVTGTLSTTSGRSASVSGSLSGPRLTATFTFTDSCAGSASTTADLINNGTRLSGDYSADDCLGSYTGDYVLDKQ
jgi:hypothetical protein